MSTKKEAAVTKQEIVNTTKEIRKSSIMLVIVLAGVLILFGALLWSSQTAEEQASVTFEDLYQQTLRGEESDINFMYKGFVFIFDEPFWYTRLGIETSEGYSEFDIPFHYNPTQVTEVAYQDGARNAVFYKEKVYLTFSPDDPTDVSVGAIQLGRVLGKRYGILNLDVESALMYNAPAGRQNITCESADADNAVIVLKIGSETSVTTSENGNCITVQGVEGDDVVRAAERLTYSLLNVEKDETPLPDAPSDLTIASAQIGDIDVKVKKAQLVKSLGQEISGIMLRDSAEGSFFVVMMEMTNNGNETIEFTPGAFQIHLPNETVRLDYEQQRFLDGKLLLETSVGANDTLLFQVAFDVPEVFLGMNMTVNLPGEPKTSVIIPIQR